MVPQPARQEQEAPCLRIFISYASEDKEIASAVAKSLLEALPEYTEVCFDKWFLLAGVEFRQQIEAKLQKTDVFIIVYTGRNKKQSHGYTGWEVGYFEGFTRHDPNREIIPMYLDQLPAVAAAYQGRCLRINDDLLRMSVEDFMQHNEVAHDDPMCVLIEDLQERAGRLKEKAGRQKPRPSEMKDPVLCVKEMRLGVFSYLKTTEAEVIRPQRKLTLETTGAALQNGDDDLPPNAKLIPEKGSGAMNIFGLADQEITWEHFTEKTAGAHCAAWRDAISSVITSAQAGINVDNTQIIPSVDDSRTYRVVLTTATRYWDDRIEYSLYFIETLPREEFGNHNTTLVFKGLEVACRYRFMFLEEASEFSADNILATRDECFRDLATKLLRELNVMRKEVNNAGLDQPNDWAQLLGNGNWKLIHEIGAAHRPKEKVLRDVLARVLSSRDPQQLDALREELAKAARELEDSVRENNGILIKKMGDKMLELVKVPA